MTTQRSDITNPYNIREAPIQEVDLRGIDDLPGPFCMSFGYDLNPLISSIQTVGLIHPPLLRRDQGAIEIIAGYRRIMALKALKLMTAPCCILGADEAGPMDCLLLNLHDNLATRKLNDVEKGMILSRISDWVPRHDIINRYLPLLGLRPHERNLLFFLEMERDFDVKTKQFIAEAGFTWRVVNMLSELDAASRRCLITLISNLKLNINQQLHLIDYLVEICHIENHPIPYIVNQMGLAGIPSNETPNRPQQARAVLDQLRARRNPSIVAAEKRFSTMVSDLNLPDGTRMSAPPFFEAEHYRLEILFRGGEELTSKLKKLTQNEGLTRLRNPWNEIP